MAMNQQTRQAWITRHAERKELVRAALGKHAKLIVNKTGNMCCQTHAHEFLPNFIGPEAKKMNNALQLPEDAPWFYAEGHAPRHYHDNCSVTVAILPPLRMQLVTASAK